MMAFRHSLVSTASDASGDVNNNTSDLLTADNLLRLALKKPKRWNWELTTSSSSPNISFPRIQLFDGASGELMVEVDRPDCVIRSDCSDTGHGTQLPSGSSSSRELVDARQGRYRRSRTSLVKEKLSTSGDSLADIFNQLQSKGLGHKLATSGSQYRLVNGDPLEQEDGRGSSLQKSKSASAIGIAPVASPTPVARRRSRRSLASRSSSILERISEFYGRSSTEEEDPRDLQLALPASPRTPQEPYQNGVTIEEIPVEPLKPHPKIYKLVRSNVGTLMVREESFHTQRSLRRRQRETGATPPEPAPPPVLVELDEQTDRCRYEREITHIDGLLARVMLSHDLQTEEEPQHRPGAPSIRITEPPGPNGCGQGRHRRRHRGSSRRSVSVGGGVTTTPPERRSTSSSSDASDRDRTGSRSSSQKRRGRTRHRGQRNGDDPEESRRAAISNASPTHSRSARGRPKHRPPERTGWWGRSCSADSTGQYDTLALEQLRASLLEATARPASGGTVTDPASCGQRTPTVQCAASREPVQSAQPEPTPINGSAPTSRSSSTAGTLSTLSGASEVSAAAVHDLPDELKRRPTMEPQPKQSKMETDQVQEEAPGPSGGRPAMARVVEQVISSLPHKVAGRPPSGRPGPTQQDAAKPESAGAVATSSAVAREEPPPPYPGTDATGADGGSDDAALEMGAATSALANTVEPPYRGRRTLKYYSRRHRSSIHYDA